MSFSIKGCPEGPPFTMIDGHPFGYATPQCSDPTSEESERKRDGYMASFNALYDRYKRSAVGRCLIFDIYKKGFLAPHESTVFCIHSTAIEQGIEETQETIHLQRN